MRGIGRHAGESSLSSSTRGTVVQGCSAVHGVCPIGTDAAEMCVEEEDEDEEETVVKEFTEDSYGIVCGGLPC